MRLGLGFLGGGGSWGCTFSVVVGTPTVPFVVIAVQVSQVHKIIGYILIEPGVCP